jgi:hypothetical protein
MANMIFTDYQWRLLNQSWLTIDPADPETLPKDSGQGCVKVFICYQDTLDTENPNHCYYGYAMRCYGVWKTGDGDNWEDEYGKHWKIVAWQPIMPYEAT